MKLHGLWLRMNFQRLKRILNEWHEIKFGEIMKTLSEIKEILRRHKEILKKKYKVKSIAIFGSYARNEQKETSDIDILVEFYKTPDLIEFVDLKYYLEDILGIKVDLVTKNALHPMIREEVLKDAEYV